MMTKKQALLQMLMTIRQRGRLPVEYQEVEYIESTGTQYVNTNVPLTMTDNVIDLSFNLKISDITNVSANNSKFLLGSTTNDFIYNTGIYQDNQSSYRLQMAIRPSGTNARIKVDFPVASEYSIYLSKDGSIVNDIVGTFITDGGNNLSGNLRILGFRRYVDRNIACKLHYFEVIDKNGVMINCFIPCYRKSDNEIGLYDTINNVFYTNAGTGTFLKGGNI